MSSHCSAGGCRRAGSGCRSVPRPASPCLSSSKTASPYTLAAHLPGHSGLPAASGGRCGLVRRVLGRHEEGRAMLAGRALPAKHCIGPRIPWLLNWSCLSGAQVLRAVVARAGRTQAPPQRAWPACQQQCHRRGRSLLLLLPAVTSVDLTAIAQQPPWGAVCAAGGCHWALGSCLATDGRSGAANWLRWECR